MKFAIITHAVHKFKDSKVYAYEPYVREMNLWGRYVSQIEIVAPISYEKISAIDSFYEHAECKVVSIPSFHIKSIKNLIATLFLIPRIVISIYKSMKRADHIHLRCPGNIGLLGCLLQILFPKKPKTAKYAGNWDPNAKQPLSYKFQKWILSNTFLTKNIKVLVYGEWQKQTNNIIPFFTASYLESEIERVAYKSLNEKINFIFVGGLTPGKQPLLSVKVVSELFKKGYNVTLNIYGEGVEREKIATYIEQNGLNEIVFLHGNVDKSTVKKAFKTSHFLVFISQSEGWPKVVAEAMFFGCLPISTAVSCVPYMLGNGERGSIVESDVKDVLDEVLMYFKDEKLYNNKLMNAVAWSNQFTLDKFEVEIKKMLLE